MRTEEEEEEEGEHTYFGNGVLYCTVEFTVGGEGRRKILLYVARF